MIFGNSRTNMDVNVMINRIKTKKERENISNYVSWCDVRPQNYMKLGKENLKACRIKNEPEPFQS